MPFPFELVLNENTGRENLLCFSQEALWSWLPALKLRIRSVVTGVVVGGEMAHLVLESIYKNTQRDASSV